MSSDNVRQLHYRSAHSGVAPIKPTAADETQKLSFFFFFQAEDGIRDYKVTGVQTCALPICSTARGNKSWRFQQLPASVSRHHTDASAQARFIVSTGSPEHDVCRETHFKEKIGRASCRERV